MFRLEPYEFYILMHSTLLKSEIFACKAEYIRLLKTEHKTVLDHKCCRECSESISNSMGSSSCGGLEGVLEDVPCALVAAEAGV